MLFFFSNLGCFPSFIYLFFIRVLTGKMRTKWWSYPTKAKTTLRDAGRPRTRQRKSVSNVKPVDNENHSFHANENFRASQESWTAKPKHLYGTRFVRTPKRWVFSLGFPSSWPSRSMEGHDFLYVDTMGRFFLSIAQPHRNKYSEI